MKTKIKIAEDSGRGTELEIREVSRHGIVGMVTGSIVIVPRIELYIDPEGNPIRPPSVIPAQIKASFMGHIMPRALTEARQYAALVESIVNAAGGLAEMMEQTNCDYVRQRVRWLDHDNKLTLFVLANLATLHELGLP